MKKDLKNKLSKLEFDVTQNNCTEPAFNNKYWDNKKEGIYVDIISGEALFSSTHKYDSGTGWPSFYQVLEPKNIIEQEDKSLYCIRTEIRTKKSNSHLGHVFDDGPIPTYKRYCMNSAAMRFIAKEDLEKEGYGAYKYLFELKQNPSIAYFAGGCFWCLEQEFLKLKGVLDVESGYMGGDEKNPSYELVCSGTTSHKEAIKISYDPDQISYDNLLRVFWLSIDPTLKNRQFCDVGPQYDPAIFVLDKSQEEAALKSRLWLKEQFKHITCQTSIEKAHEFYKAEEYHQRFAQKNPEHYASYQASCGREERLKELYEKTREDILKALRK